MHTASREEEVKLLKRHGLEVPQVYRAMNMLEELPEE